MKYYEVTFSITAPAAVMQDARDIVCDNAELTDCVFIQRNLEARGNMDVHESLKIMELIWGKEKMNDYVKKKGIIDKNGW